MKALYTCVGLLLSASVAAGQGVTALLPTLTFNPILAGKASQVFTTSPNPQSWTAPPGTDVFYVEIWGGGGAGSIVRGGQGGGYVLLKVKVKPAPPASPITIRVGQGGNNLTNKRDGESSVVTIGFYRATARGGAGTDNTTADGGYGTEILGNTDVMGNGSVGELGQTNTYAGLAARDSLQLYILEKGGCGGNAGATRNTGGNGGTLIKVAKAPTVNTYRFTGALAGTEPDRGRTPGGGGGAKPYFKPGFWVDNTLGSRGGDGLVIIYW